MDRYYQNTANRFPPEDIAAILIPDSLGNQLGQNTIDQLLRQVSKRSFSYVVREPGGTMYWYINPQSATIFGSEKMSYGNTDIEIFFNIPMRLY
jgi:hypothetical protein